METIVFRNDVIQAFAMPGIDSRMYILTCGHTALIIDPHVSPEAEAYLRQEGCIDVTALLTHEHFDHTSGVNRLRECYSSLQILCLASCAANLASIPLNMARFFDIFLMGCTAEEKRKAKQLEDPAYTCFADKSFLDGDTLNWQGHTILCKAAPGHSRGGCLYIMDDEVLFSGDNLVNGMEIITRFPGGNLKLLNEITLPLLGSLPDSLLVCPGHGDSDTLDNLRKFACPMGRTALI